MHIKTYTYTYTHTHTHTHTYIYPAISYKIRKPRRFSLIPLPFAHRKNGSLSFVWLLTKKQTEVIHLLTD